MNTTPAKQVIPDDYDAKKDGERSYYAAIAAKKARGDHLEDRIWALEQNMLALERYAHDLEKDLRDVKKALSNG